MEQVDHDGGEGCSPRKVNMTLSLALVAPEIVNAAIEGRLPRGVGISRLSDLLSWPGLLSFEIEGYLGIIYRASCRICRFVWWRSPASDAGWL
jgi:hypothetical protein